MSNDSTSAWLHADGTTPMQLWSRVLPTGLGGVGPAEPRSQAGCDTLLRIWPVLAFVQGDTPFMAATMGACGHSGHKACWRCASETVRLPGLGGKHYHRWTLYQQRRQMPALTEFATGKECDTPHLPLPDRAYCVPQGYPCQPARPAEPQGIRWQGSASAGWHAPKVRSAAHPTTAGRCIDMLM